MGVVYESNLILAENVAVDLTGETPLLPTLNIQAGLDPEGIFRPSPSTGIDNSNSTPLPPGTLLLGAGESFIGDWRNVEGYEAVSISAKSDQVSAVNGIYTQFADDALGTNTRTARRETYTTDSAGNLAYYTWHGTLGRFMRVVWINGAVPQNDFFISTELHVNATELPQSPVNSSLGGGTPAIVTRSVIAGRKDDGTNTFENVNIHQEQGFQSLAVGQGHRISQMFGRSHFEYNNGFAELVGNTLLFTVPVGQILHVTSIGVSIANTSNNNPGKIIIADSVTAGTGDTIFSTFVNEVSGGTQTSANITQSYPEPLRVENGLYFNEVQGTTFTNVNIVGYLEDL